MNKKSIVVKVSKLFINKGVGGESDSLNQVNVSQCVACIRKYPEDIVGVKVRITANITDQGKVEKEVYRYGDHNTLLLWIDLNIWIAVCIVNNKLRSSLHVQGHIWRF